MVKHFNNAIHVSKRDRVIIVGYSEKEIDDNIFYLPSCSHAVRKKEASNIKPKENNGISK